ncbi:BTB/POZ domain [Trinorchestia longiramus]|nr:BTB/POZ domain [Trinorchestia longiramus]
MVAEWSDCSANSSSTAEKLNGVLDDGSQSPSQSHQPYMASLVEAQSKASHNGIIENQSSEVCSSVTIAQSELDKKLYYISSQNHDFLLSSSLSKLAVEDGYQDVIVLCDGHSLAAHKLVLAAASHFLKAIFQDMASDQPACVTVEGVKWPILCHIMQYIYIGQSYVQQEDVAEFIAAGQLLGICGLKDLHEYLLDHQKILSRDSSNNGCEKVEAKENSKVCQDSDGIIEHSGNKLPVTNVSEAEKSSSEECKPATTVGSNGFSRPATRPMVMHPSASEQILGLNEGNMTQFHPSSFKNEQIVPGSQKNPGASVRNVHISEAGSEDPIKVRVRRSIFSESFVENKCKGMKSSGSWTNTCEESPQKRLKLSDPNYTDGNEQGLQCDKKNPELPEGINVSIEKSIEIQNYVNQASNPDLPLSFGKPTFVSDALATCGNVQPSDKYDISAASVEKSSSLPLATWPNASSGAPSSSSFFNGLEIRPSEKKTRPRGLTASDTSVPTPTHQHKDLPNLPPAHLSGHYGATVSDAWKDTFTADAFPSNAQPYGVDGQAIGKLLSALAAQNMTARLEQRQTALPNGTISNNPGASRAESSGSSHHDFLKNETAPFPLGGGLPAQLLSKLSSDGALSGDVTSMKDSLSTSDLGSAAPDANALHKTSNGASNSTASLPMHKFATQEEIEIVLDQYQRKLAFHEPRPCPCCDRMYRDAATLRTHLTIMHTPGQEPFLCTCGAQFQTKYEVHHHKKNGHYLTAASYS